MTALEEVRASELLVFVIDDIRYGLPADDVVELTRAVAIAPLPQADQTHLLEGIVNFHGELAAAINLRSRFGHRHKPLSPSEHFVFSRSGRHLLALRADAVQELIKAPVEALDVMAVEGRNLSGSGDRGQGLGGVCKLSDGLVFIFDMHTFLSTSEALNVERTLSQAKNQIDKETTK